MSNPSPKPGQRWMWDDGTEKAVAEVCVERNSYGEMIVKVIQIIKGRGISGYGLGRTLSLRLGICQLGHTYPGKINLSEATMRIFGKDWTPSMINAATFELRCGKETVTVRRSPANDGSWFPVGKGSWLALTFRVENNTLLLGGPKK